MSVVSKLTFVPFTPYSTDTDTVPHVYQSNRDTFRGEVRGGLNTMFARETGIEGMSLPYTAEQYARLVVWCLRLLLDGWPAHIPYANLSDIKGGTAALRLLRDLLHDGTLTFIPAPEDVRQRALHDPESVLPHVMSAAKQPPLPRTILMLKFSLSHFSDLIAPCGQVTPLTRRRPVPTRTHLPAVASASVSAEERVLDPDTLEPVLTMPIGPRSSQQLHERRQRCDTNKARPRPVSNPEGRPTRARKVGVLTSTFVVDRPNGPSVAPPSRQKPMKPLSEHRLALMVEDYLGGYAAPGRVDAEEEDEIESFSDSDSDSADERERRVKRRWCS